MHYPSVLPLLFLCTGIVKAQFVTPPTDLITTKGYLDIPVRYKQVPTGICETDPNVKSYSGYVDVAEGQHMFFWFFEARNQDPTTAPLTVWINGGPGSSSMIGLFQENGPCFIDEDLNVINNPYSWNNASNMLYIDQPTKTGFSYSVPVSAYVDSNTGNIISLPSADCPDYAQDLSCGTYSYPNLTLTANSTDAAAPFLWRTIQGFMGAFPQYDRDGFHFATESYGGHYGPVFNEYFEAQNQKNISGAKKVGLETVLIGNGWFDPILQYIAYYNFTVSPGNTYIPHPLNASISSLLYNAVFGPGNCVDMLRTCAATGLDSVCSTGDAFCANQVEEVYDIYLQRDEYDFRALNTNSDPDPFPPSFFSDYLNTPTVQAAIGAYVNWTSFSEAVGNAFSSTGDDGRRMRTVKDMRALLAQNGSVIIYTGDADYICNWLGTQAVAEELDAPGYSAAGFVNVSTPDGVVHGQVRQAGKYAFVRVYESGHEVPFYQPVLALTMFQRAISGKDVATGNVLVGDAYRTTGPSVSTYFEGPATVQNETLPLIATYNTTTNAPNPPALRRRWVRGRRR